MGFTGVGRWRDERVEAAQPTTTVAQSCGARLLDHIPATNTARFAARAAETATHRGYGV